MKYIIYIMLLLVGGAHGLMAILTLRQDCNGEKGKSLIQKYQAVKVDVDSPLELYEIKNHLFFLIALVRYTEQLIKITDLYESF